jgi:outer membrane lipoprotein-sorting protein
MKTILFFLLFAGLTLAARCQSPVIFQHVSEQQLNQTLAVDSLTGYRGTLVSIAGRPNYQLASQPGDVWLLTPTRAYRHRRREESAITLSGMLSSPLRWSDLVSPENRNQPVSIQAK